MEEDVQLLFAYARRGDVQSLAALVRRHATWMQVLLRGMLPVAADVDDVFQETWMRVIRAAPCYRGGMVKPYLATVARSAAIDHLRRTRAVVSLDDEEGEGAAAAATAVAEGPAPEERLSAASPGSSPRVQLPPARHIVSMSSLVRPALSRPSTTPTQQGTQSRRQNACSHSVSAAIFFG